MFQPMQYITGMAFAVFLPLACMIGHEASAQSPELEGESARVAYTSGHVWLSTGLAASVQSIASSPSGYAVAITTDGTVLRRGHQQGWREVLGPPGLRLEDADAVDEERLLLDVEGFLDEMQDSSMSSERSSTSRSGDTEDEDEIDEPEPTELEAPSDAVSELTDVYIEDSQGDGSSMGPRTGQTVWMSHSTSGLTLVERSDGVWRSNDHGHTWTRSESLPGVHSFSDGPNQRVYAGTQAGLRVSADLGATWRSVRGPLATIETFCFGRDGAVMYAGTAEGLFRSTGESPWAKLLSRYDADIPVWTIAMDAHWENGLWVAGPVGILRSDDGGEQLRSAGQNTLMGTVSLLPLSAPGHILSAGIDGVWESLDGGLRWRPIVNGLPSSANRLLTMSKSGPLVSGLDGTYVLKVAEPPLIEEAPEILRDPVGADMATLVRVALNRPGMAMEEVLIKRSIIRALLLPELILNGRMDRARMISADYDAEANTGSMRRAWSFGLTACFGACRSGTGYRDSPYDEGLGEVDVDVLDETVAVVAGEVYDATGSASLAPMAANVAQQFTRYGTDISGRVNELVLARHRLLEAGTVIQTLSLREQVSHQLDVLESAARLDVYTNGYFTRVLTDS